MIARRNRSDLYHAVKVVVLIVIEDNHMFLEKLGQIFLGVQLLPVGQAVGGEGIKHLSLLKVVHFLGLLRVPLLVESDELQKQVLPNLHQRQRHVNLAVEARMHSEEGSAHQFLEGRHEVNLHIFNVNHVQVPHVEAGRALINEELALDRFVEVVLLGVLVLGQISDLVRWGWLVDGHVAAFQQHVGVLQQFVELLLVLGELLAFLELGRFGSGELRIILELEVAGKEPLQRGHSEDVSEKDRALGNLQNVAVPIGQGLINTTQLHFII